MARKAGPKLAASWGSYRSPILGRLLARGWEALDFQPRAVGILMADLRRWASSSPDDGPGLPNAYLFSGPPGCGQEEAFVLLAASVLCSRREGRGAARSPCLACRSCSLVIGGTHPDVSILEPEGNTYLVDFIRDRVVSEAKYSAPTGAQRFILLRESERLSRAASNALLRTVEEPAGRVSFVLQASPDRDAVLETLASRCREISFSPIPPARLEELLIEAGYDVERVEAATAASGGSLEGAAEAAQTGSYADFTATAARLIRPLFYDASANPLEISGMLRRLVESVVDEMKAAFDSEIEDAVKSDEELGLSTESGRAQALRASRHRRLRRVETALCRQIVNVFETLALGCGLTAYGLEAEAARRLDRIQTDSAGEMELLASSLVAGPNSVEYLRRITALGRQARASLLANPRADLWLDGVITGLAEIVVAV